MHSTHEMDSTTVLAAKHHTLSAKISTNDCSRQIYSTGSPTIFIGQSANKESHGGQPLEYGGACKSWTKPTSTTQQVRTRMRATAIMTATCWAVKTLVLFFGVCTSPT